MGINTKKLIEKEFKRLRKKEKKGKGILSQKILGSPKAKIKGIDAIKVISKLAGRKR